MASEFDPSDFVDSDFQAAQKARAARVSTLPSPSSPMLTRPPTREELDVKVGETQQRLAELKRAQDALERERAALEEARRRQSEFQTGREEMLQHLTRGTEKLGEAEFAARRDAEQMARTLAGFREALDKLQGIHTDTWTTDNYNVELTRALTVIENARMEWNAARLKWPLLTTANTNVEQNGSVPGKPAAGPLDGKGFWELCKLGLALTWPLAVIALGAVVTFAVLWFSR
jgi:hypothetical protein